MSHRAALVATLALSLISTYADAYRQLTDDEDVPLAPLTPSPAPRARPAIPPRASPPSAVRPKRAIRDASIAPLEAGAATRPGRTEIVVRVSGQLRGAQWSLDGRDQGPVTGAPFIVAPGARDVRVRRTGYADFSRRIKTVYGRRTLVVASLAPVAAVLTVLADVPDARVYIDGGPAVAAPLKDSLLAPGTHQVRVVREGFADHVQVIRAEAGVDLTVNAVLREEAPLRSTVARADRPVAPSLTPAHAKATAPSLMTDPVGSNGGRGGVSAPWFKRWYVWAGLGAVATAATIGVMAASRGGSEGRPSPDYVCGGPCDGVLRGPTAFQ